MSEITKESKLLAKHSLIYGFGYFLNRIAGLLLLPVYTRFLTPHDYGVKELVGLSTDVIAILLSTAISSAIYRFYFEYECTKDRNEVISSAIIGIGGIGLIALVLLSFATRTLASYILDSSNLYYFFLISFSSMWFQSINEIGYNYLRANQESLKFITLSFFKLLVMISLNIYLVCFVNIGVLGVLISTLVTSVIMSVIIVVSVFFKVGFHFSLNKIKEMLCFGVPVIPAQLGSFIVNLSDRFFIKAYCSIADAGLYSLGYRFGELPSSFISMPFNLIWGPRRFELYKKENSERVFGKIFTYFLYLLIFAGLFVSVLSKDILILMADNRFWSAYKIVPIIVLATTINSFQNHLNMGILISKKTKYFAYINISIGVFILILNFILIPRYGVYGAAYATLIAFSCKVYLTYYFSSKCYKIYFEFLRITKLLISAGIIYFLTANIDFNSVYISAMIKTMIILLYPIVLYFFSFYSQSEKKNIFDFFSNRQLSLKSIIPKHS